MEQLAQGIEHSQSEYPHQGKISEKMINLRSSLVRSALFSTSSEVPLYELKAQPRQL
jgi:hypothetical protein